MIKTVYTKHMQKRVAQEVLVNISLMVPDSMSSLNFVYKTRTHAVDILKYNFHICKQSLVHMYKACSKIQVKLIETLHGKNLDLDTYIITAELGTPPPLK